MANNSVNGLNGSVFAADTEHALSVARRIRTGTVEVNGNPVGFTAPIGGFKNSGIGREAGPEGFDAYVELKSYGLPAAALGSLSGPNLRKTGIGGDVNVSSRREGPGGACASHGPAPLRAVLEFARV